MELKPGYKQTEVGIIPTDWEVLPLKSVCRLNNGRAYALHEWEKSGTPVIRLQNLTGGDEYYYSTMNLSEDKYCNFGDLLFMWSATFGPRIWFGERAIYHYHIWKVIPYTGTATSKYLFYRLSTITEEKKTRSANGGTMLHVTKGEMEGTLIAMPTLAEQEAITAALSDADALIESLERLLVKKRQVKQGAMSELLSGKRRLPGFSGKWQTKPFDDVLMRINAKAHQVLTSDYQSAGRYPVVDQGKQQVVGYSDRQDKCFHCPDGGVIVFGDHTCIVKFVNYDFLIGADGTQLLKAQDGQHTCFYAFQLQHKGIIPTGYNRHFKFLKERAFLVPSFEEQTAIAEILGEMEAELAALEAKLSKARAVKQGMMQELLTGRIRLVS